MKSSKNKGQWSTSKLIRSQYYLNVKARQTHCKKIEANVPQEYKAKILRNVSKLKSAKLCFLSTTDLA